MISQEEVAFNRMLFATKGIFTLIVVCCILTFDHIELKNLRSNSKILHFLSQVDKTEDSYFAFQNFELLRIKWLKENFNSVYDRHVQSRTSMIQMLKSKIRILDGEGNERQISYEDKGGGETESYNELTIGESTNRIALMNKLTSTYHDLKKQNSTSDPISSHVVDSSISRFMILSKLDTVEVLTSIDTILLNAVFHTLVSQTSRLDSLSNQEYRRKTLDKSQKLDDDGNWSKEGNRNEHPSYPTDISIKLNEIKLEGQKLFFQIKHKGSLPDFPTIVITEVTHLNNTITPNNYGTDPNNGGTHPSEFGYTYYRIGIPVTIDTIIFPTMYFFNRFDNDIANSLKDDATKLKNISRLYGFYPVESAEKTSMDTYIHRISSVSILGFNFSRASFSFVLMILTLGFYSLLFVEVQRLGTITSKDFLNLTAQNTMGFLIELSFARFFTWVVAPFVFLIVVISNFIVVLPLLTYSFAILICVTIFILGLKSYLRISKLK